MVDYSCVIFGVFVVIGSFGVSGFCIVVFNNIRCVVVVSLWIWWRF